MRKRRSASDRALATARSPRIDSTRMSWGSSRRNCSLAQASLNSSARMWSRACASWLRTHVSRATPDCGLSCAPRGAARQRTRPEQSQRKGRDMGTLLVEMGDTSGTNDKRSGLAERTRQQKADGVRDREMNYRMRRGKLPEPGTQVHLEKVTSAAGRIARC